MEIGEINKKNRYVRPGQACSACPGFLRSDYDKEGVDLSGGEEQKIAILRTLLRKCKVTIMDEPTAALDPQAEYDIYQMIDESVSNHLMIYISHRLASSRFYE